MCGLKEMDVDVTFAVKTDVRKAWEVPQKA